MIIDTSALLAIVFREPGFERLVDLLSAAESIGIGAPTLAETGIVLQARLGKDPSGLLARLLQEFAIVTVSFGEAHGREAIAAYARFGRGRHEAALNFGDCLAYAIARLAGEPLLAVGGDFEKTDLDVVAMD